MGKRWLVLLAGVAAAAGFFLWAGLPRAHDPVPALEIPRGAPIAGPPIGSTAQPSVSPEKAGATPPAAAAAENGPLPIDFDLIGAFDYKPEVVAGADEAARRAQIPDAVRALDGREVTIEGYMLPLDFERGRIRSFYLNRDTQQCCYGIAPKVNQTIHVRVAGAGIPNYSNIPILVTGRFELHESAGEFGFVASLYRMEAKSVEKTVWR